LGLTGFCSAGAADNGGFLASLRAFLGEPRHARRTAIGPAYLHLRARALQKKGGSSIGWAAPYSSSFDLFCRLAGYFISIF
jgi:hypothetical protein